MTNINKKEDSSKTDITESSKETIKQELSREEKKRLRKEAISEKDSLAIDERLKEPGKRYRLCNVTPGNIERYRSMGYEVTKNTLPTGSGSLSNAQSAKGCVEVTVGRSSDLKAIWMETSDENYEILREIDAEKAKAQDAMIYESEIPEANRIGDVKRKYEN